MSAEHGRAGNKVSDIAFTIEGLERPQGFIDIESEI